MSIEFEASETTENPEAATVQPTTERPAGEIPANTDQGSIEEPETSQVKGTEITPSPEPTTTIQKRKTANVERAPENKKRLAITVNFPAEESEYVEAIIEARVKSGLTVDKGHFIRQCVDFAIHMEKLHGRHQAGFSFATPADLPVTYLKGGFFKPKK